MKSPRSSRDGKAIAAVTGLCILLFFGLQSCAPSRQVARPAPKFVSITEPEPDPTQETLPPPKTIPSRDYDLLHTRIDISFIDWQNHSIEATATLTLMPFPSRLDRLILDAGNMTVHGVAGLGRDSLAAEYDPVAETLTIDLDPAVGYGDTVTLVIRYTAHSEQKGLFFIEPDSLNPTRPLQIWTQGEAEDNHYWFPTFDDPIERMTSEVIVTVPDTLETLSNGRLVAQQHHPDGMRTDHWLQDKSHAPYLVMLAVGNYAIVEDEWQGVPLQYYVYPQHEQYARLVFGDTPDVMSFFSEKLGVPYPWDKYAQVIVSEFTAGAMENTSATVLAEWVMHDERGHIDASSLDIIAHELAHHWFGNLVTAESWAQIFLNESLASYCEVLYFEHAFGRDEARMHLLNQRRTYLQISARTGQRPMLFRNYEDPDRLFDVFSYQKGSNLFHMLRYVLGEEGFWRSLHVYLERNRFRSVDLDDLQDAILEATGQNLEWFFEQWFLREGHPKFKVIETWDGVRDTLTLTVLQTQEEAPFRMPVEVEVLTDDDTQRFRVWVDDALNVFKFGLSSEPKMVIFDKGDWILKELDFPRSKEELLFQLAYDDDALGRMQAAELLKAHAMPADSAVERSLIAALRNDPFWGARRQAAATLGLFQTPDASQALMAAIADRSSKVRAAVIDALGRSDSQQALPLIERALSADSSYQVVAAAIRAIGRLDTLDAFSRLAPLMEQDSHQDIIRRTVLSVFRRLGDRRAIPIAQKYARPGHDRFLRLTAVSTLMTLATHEDSAVVEQLIGMIRDPYFQAQLFAIRGLGELGAERALEPLRAFSVETTDRRLMSAAAQAIERIETQMSERKAAESGEGRN